LSHEKWLITGLSFTILVILSLILALTISLGWNTLAISTLLFVIAYPLIWLAWHCYNFWCQTIMQLTTYTQILKEGESNLRFKKQHKDNLSLALQQEISALVLSTTNNKQHQQTLEQLLSHVLDAWPIPVCLFDQDMKLTYRNSAMNEQIQQPMLLGALAEDLGFSLEYNQLNHENFNDKWQCQSISFSQHAQQQWLFSAINISQLLHQNQSVTQQNLIRVLGHELRNSLTPMSSMTDTLLNNPTIDEQQTRLVLSRIKNRSDRLLSFIDKYSKLTQLPAPKCTLFNFKEVFNEAKSMQNSAESHIHFTGIEQCFGDSEQVSQMLINLFKNAIEAKKNGSCDIVVKLFHDQSNQMIEINDNGSGFANLDNALTPFYTTKKQGSGIGLALCVEIARNHQGYLTVDNNISGGAKVTISWPLQSST
jgi:signal transduction histidine kinase